MYLLRYLSANDRRTGIEQETGSLSADVLGKGVPNPQWREIIAAEGLVQGKGLFGMIKDDPDRIVGDDLLRLNQERGTLTIVDQRILLLNCNKPSVIWLTTGFTKGS
jgi:hypothetical protein